MSGKWLSKTKKYGRKQALALAITAGLLSGGYAAVGYAADQPTDQPTEKVYNLQIIEGTEGQDGGDSHRYQWFKDKVRFWDDGQFPRYEFKQNTVLNISKNSPMFHGGITIPEYAAISWAGWNNGVMNLHNNRLTLNVDAGYDKDYKTYGIKVTSGDVTMNDVGGLDINMNNPVNSTGIVVVGVNNGGNMGDSGSGNASLTINNDDSKDHAVKVRFSDPNRAGTCIQVKNNVGTAALDIKGLVDLQTSGMYENGLSVMDGKASIGGGSIVSDNFFAVSNSGQTLINAEYDNQGKLQATSDTRDVNIDGGIRNSAGKIGVALNTSNSTLDGRIYNVGGEVNMLLGNNAVWRNQAVWSDPDFNASSVVNNFTGGSDAEHAGIIEQKDSYGLKLNNYSGHTLVFYEHTGNGTEASHYAAGDTVIKHAEVGSGITLSTGNNGINMQNTDEVNTVLNTLAGKLTYDNYKNGENNLSGKVQIASGLTSSSASAVVGDITFDENGKGGYQPVEEEVDYNFVGQITGNRDDDAIFDEAGVIVEDGKYVFNGKQDVTITGDSDNYQSSPLYASQSFTLDTNGRDLNLISQIYDEPGAGFYSDWMNTEEKIDVVIDAKNVNMEIDGTSDTAGIYLEGASDDTSSLTVNGNVNMDVHSTGGSFVYGICASELADITVNGNVTVKGEDGSWGAQQDYNQRFSNSTVAGLYTNAGYNSGAGSITVNGDVDLVVKGSGIFAEADGSEITVNGGGSILVDKDMVSYESNGVVHYNDTYGLAANGGTVSMNMNQDKTAAEDNDVNISGNIGVFSNDQWTSSKVNLGLSTDKSVLHGVVFNENIDGAGNTEANLWVSNGATWINEDYGHVPLKDDEGNEVFTGSFVDKFTGGNDAEHAGLIVQKDSHNLTLNNYSGHSYLVYEHINDGTNTTDFAAGDTHIKNAAAGSGVTMVTGNNGIDMGNTEMVNKVLNNLAGKLYYDAYVNGEKNLSGVVQISSGLTSSSVSQSLASGDMTFNDKTGQGSVVEDSVAPAPPEHQTEVNFSDAITGDSSKDKVYIDAGVLKENGEYVFEKDSNITLNGAAINAQKDVVIKAEGSTLNVKSSSENAVQGVIGTSGNDINITADKLVVNTESTNGRVDGIYMTNGNIIVDGDVDVRAVGNSANGAYMNQGNHTFNGNFTSYVDGKGGGWGYYGASGLYVTSQMGKTEGANVTVNGMVNLSGNANGIFANAGGATVTVQGGKIVVDDKNNKGYSAIRAENGIVNMNVKLDEDGNVVGTTGNLVDIKGNIVVGTGAVNSNDVHGTDTAINLALDTKESKLHGLILNEFDADGEIAGDLTFTGETNLWLQNGATWINENVGAQQTKEGASGSVVTNFVGGSDADHAGNIFQKDSNALTIENYSGYTNVYYAHEMKDGKADFSALGDTVIKNAAANSGISMMTDNSGIDMKNEAKVEEVLNDLAGKLQYVNHKDGNLTGKVGIASGLTSGSASLQVGDITFGEDGRADYEDGSMKPGVDKPVTPEYGDYESYMMAGARAAMTDSMLNFRDMAADGFKRTGELRSGIEEGAWARIYGGESKYESGNTNFDTSYKAVQAGFDKEVGDWTMGLAIDYRDGDSDYMLGGEGEHKTYTVGVYGTKDMGAGSYLDLSVKAGKVENDYKVKNEIGQTLSGSYSAPGYSVSAQYGKRMESGSTYFEPQMQFTWTHVNSDDYSAVCGSETMNIDQDAFDSLVGRIGIETGMNTEKGNLFARLSLNHEFAGDGAVEASYFAKDGGLKQTSYDIGDTWSEITVGGNYKLSKCANFYADVTKALTGDYKQDWKVNAGMSFSF